MYLMKKVLVLSLAAAMTIGLTACAGSNASTAASNVAVGSRNANIRFSWWGGDDRAQKTLEVIKQFEKKYPKIKVEAEYQGSDGYNDKLATELSAGTAPDLMQVGTGYFPSYVESTKNYFVDFATTKVDLSGFDKDFLKSNGNYKGKQYGLPTGTTGYSLIVNKDLADKAGLDFTKQYTWDDLFDMSAKVKSVDSDAYLLESNITYMVYNVVRPYIRQLTGKAVFDDSEKKLGVNEAQMTEVLTLIKKLYDEKVVPSASHMASYEKDNMQTDPAWVSGKYVSAFAVASTMDVMAKANTKANYIAGKMPTIKDGKSEGYFTDCPSYYCMSSKSTNQPETAALLDYILNNKDAAKTLGACRSVPPTTTGREVCKENKLVTDITEQAVDVSMSYKGKSDSGYTTSSEVESILDDTVSAVAYGKSTPSAAAANAIKLLNNFLANKQ